MQCWIHDGRLFATKHEAPKGAQPFTLADDKAARIALINSLVAGKPLLPRAPGSSDEARWRVYFKGNFAGAIRATGPDDALTQARSMLEVRRDKAGDRT